MPEAAGPSATAQAEARLGELAEARARHRERYAAAARRLAEAAGAAAPGGPRGRLPGAGEEAADDDGALEARVAELAGLLEAERAVAALIARRDAAKDAETWVRHARRELGAVRRGLEAGPGPGPGEELAEELARVDEATVWSAARALQACVAASRAFDPAALPEAAAASGRAVEGRVEAALGTFAEDAVCGLRACLAAGGWSGLGSGRSPAASNPDHFLEADAAVLAKTVFFVRCTGVCQQASEALGAPTAGGGVAAAAAGDPRPDTNLEQLGQPVPWAARELMAEVRQKLTAHFSSGQKTDRLDKPEWIFQFALRAAKDAQSAVHPLEKGLEGAGDSGGATLAAGVVRAVADATEGLLREAYLPRVAAIEEDGDAYWIHAAAEAEAFDRSVVGLLLGPAVEDLLDAPVSSVVAVWGFGTCLRAFMAPAWRRQWLGAVLRLDARRFDEAASAAGWETAISAAGYPEQDFLGEAGLEEDDPGAVPRCAQDTLYLIEKCLGRCRSLRGAAERAAFAEGALGGLLKHVQDRLDRRAKSFAALGPLNQAEPIRGVAQCLSFAAFLADGVEDFLELPFLAAADGAGLARFRAGLAEYRAAWTAEVAAAVANAFEAASGRYRIHAAHFQETAARPGAEVTPSLALPLNQLREALQAVQAHLARGDAKDVRRRVAGALQDLLIESLGVRAVFSAQGAKQFLVDCRGLEAVFAAHPAPAQLFRGLEECCLLLDLDFEEVRAVMAAVRGAEDSEEAKTRMGQLVQVLDPAVALQVMYRRLDVREAEAAA